VDRERRRQRQDERGDECDAVLHGGGHAEVDVGAEALLVDPARRQTEQRDQEQQHRWIEALLGDQPAGTCRQNRGDPETERDDATQRQRIAQERRREQGGCDGIHRHDDRAQHCRRPVLNGEVERAELDGLHEQTRDCDVAELAPRRPCRPDDERPGTQDDRGDTEPDDEDGHRRHRLHSHVADGVAQRVEEGDRRRSSGWHPGRRHGSMVSTPSRPVQRLLAIVTDRDSLSIRASLVEYLASAQRFDPFC